MKNILRAVALFTILSLAAVMLAAAPAPAQTTLKATVPGAVSITTGLTYQQIVAAGSKVSITIQNNNTSDSCWIIVGGPFLAGDTTATSRTIAGASISALKASIVLAPAGSYTRYMPYIPGDTILGTCTTTGDSIYVDTQQ
jgi:hypothetical protein